MGILDWFKNRPAQFDPDRVSDEMIRGAVDKAIALTNPRLKLLPHCHKRLTPSVETTIEFLRALVQSLPAARPLSSAVWASDPALRAFFVSPSDIPAVLGSSDNLRTLFDKFPGLDEAYLVLGMALKEQRVFGIALHGGMVQRDVAQTSVSFSDHRARFCGGDDSRLRRVVGVGVYEYLLAQALSEIGEERVERQELQASRSLIRARLRLLQQHGPGLGSMFGDAPAAASEQAGLQAQLLENERQLEVMGGSESVLEAELECLKALLDNPQRYLHVEPRHLRLSKMNVVLDEASTEAAADVDFCFAELRGSPPMQRAFVLARVARSEVPPPQTINFADASRYL
ncbi:MAG: hypothetical protein AW11_03042 [Candidatus Accumulibacter regalis]|jgi:hypothetical protein|uniref:Uncharacterized protein n=1 Tax=Accumulibacter regalis TaxID=522306 RepID=A0A011QAW3_ACCRE|nr:MULTISPECIES: hypothetical protein [unclassified Candidatus Accumulibacter]EXI86265.1 MAG: hypothetical protein AW11_03042 [Candidatus Accumulibacter regalis]MQM32974.1 hypothetical protein [Candidatus Accumulibacter phosphatis]MBL8368641.1 hypothetical protein [Accumulibacter sp.]MBN8515329.1 hypothetical protein [Accumulibacter sp.]MBO3703779.1 hypothetical protein [Accumulibacter sp.]